MMHGTTNIKLIFYGSEDDDSKPFVYDKL